MTISENVQKQFFRTAASTTDGLIRLPPTVIMSHNLPREAPRAPFIKTQRRLNLWTVEEHELFLRGLELYPRGPWKAIAAVVGTKTTRQTMTHAQKYRQKIRRLSAGQAIKIHRMPSVDTSEDAAPREERANADGVNAELDVPPVVDGTAGTCLSGTPVEPVVMFQDWEMDALLVELSQSVDVPFDVTV